MSLLPDLSTTSVVDLSGETNFIASAAKAEATVRRKARKREIFNCMQGVSALDQEKSAMADEKLSDKPSLYHEAQRFPSFSDFDRCFICLWHFVGRSKRQN